jgi:glycosyltransferase involved in cell wall biosynthesis
MRTVDLVLVPSIWWENSPVVIQESLRNRVPIICSNIGGMAEKVMHGRDGLQFPVGDATALSTLLAGLAKDRKRLAQLAKSLRMPDPPETTIEAHAELYQRVLAREPVAA